jgi:peptide/nickel transport system permease protein
MGWHIIKRLLQAVPALLRIATITFFIMHLAPGNPMEMLIDPRIRARRNINSEMIEMLRKKYGLDQPVHMQYVKWVNN